MKKKVEYFDKKLRDNFQEKISLISTVLSLILIFFDIPNKYKVCSGIIFLIGLLIMYWCLWYRANNMFSVSFCINETVINIEIGDIFNETGIKVIPFNE